MTNGPEKSAAAGGNAGAAAPSADDIRRNILNCLTDKMLSLNSIISKIEEELDDITDPQEYEDALEELIETKAERDLCLARSQQIHASRSFRDPGEAAERALIAAIAKVDQALATATAVTDLLSAADGLVKAYAAKGTYA